MHIEKASKTLSRVVIAEVALKETTSQSTSPAESQRTGDVTNF